MFGRKRDKSVNSGEQKHLETTKTVNEPLNPTQPLRYHHAPHQQVNSRPMVSHQQSHRRYNVDQYQQKKPVNAHQKNNLTQHQPIMTSTDWPTRQQSSHKSVSSSASSSASTEQAAVSLQTSSSKDEIVYSLQDSLASTLKNAESGHESVGSYTIPSVLASLHGSPYMNLYRRINEHELHQNIKQRITKNREKITVNHLANDVAKYTSSIGNVAASRHLLMAETEPTIELSKQITKQLQLKNQRYKEGFEQEIYEDLKCISIVGIRVHSKQFHLVSISGTQYAPTARRLAIYLKEIVRDDQHIIVLPEMSNNFKQVVDFFAQLDLEIPEYKTAKNCAEFAFLATLAKLLYTYGDKVFVTGIVNIPVLIADNRIVQTDAHKKTADARLGAWKNGNPWQFEGHTIHHWKCCDNCKNNKPLYLSILGVMQDLGKKNLVIDTDLEESSEQELLTSPLQARLRHIIAANSVQHVKQAETRSTSSQLANDLTASAAATVKSNAPSMKAHPAKKHFDFQDSFGRQSHYRGSNPIFHAQRQSLKVNEQSNSHSASSSSSSSSSYNKWRSS